MMDSWYIFLITLNIVLLAGLIFTNRRIRKVSDVNRTLIAQVTQVPQLSEVASEINIELERARRYQRSLCLLLLKPTRTLSRKSESPEAPVSLTTFLVTGSILQNTLRDHDILALTPDRKHYLMVLVETERDQAHQTAQRLRSRVHRSCGAAVACGVAEFPNDGLILEDLTRTAENGLTGGSIQLLQPSQVASHA